MAEPIQLEKSVVVNGKKWNLFSVEFKTVDSTYSTYLYAVSNYHAQILLEDLKDSAEITGQIL